MSWSAARHYALIDELVAHYREQMTLNLIEIRYEDLVREQEAHVCRVLSHVGVAFEPACLRSHENRRYARTASYAQVAEPLYDRSISRYRHYLRHLEPVMPMLASTMARGGYVS